MLCAFSQLPAAVAAGSAPLLGAPTRPLSFSPLPGHPRDPLPVLPASCFAPRVAKTRRWLPGPRLHGMLRGLLGQHGPAGLGQDGATTGPGSGPCPVPPLRDVPRAPPWVTAGRMLQGEGVSLLPLLPLLPACSSSPGFFHVDSQQK